MPPARLLEREVNKTVSNGATVMGNGRVALILDVASFVRHAGAHAVA